MDHHQDMAHSQNIAATDGRDHDNYTSFPLDTPYYGAAHHSYHHKCSYTCSNYSN